MQVKLGDFGLAVRVENEDELQRQFVGTPGYMAPEIVALNAQNI